MYQQCFDEYEVADSILLTLMKPNCKLICNSADLTLAAFHHIFLKANSFLFSPVIRSDHSKTGPYMFSRSVCAGCPSWSRCQCWAPPNEYSISFGPWTLVHRSMLCFLGNSVRTCSMEIQALSASIPDQILHQFPPTFSAMQCTFPSHH